MRGFLLVALIGAGVGLFYGPFRELAVLSFDKALYSHTLLIPIVSFYILWVNRKRVFAEMSVAPVFGGLLLLLGLVLLLVHKSLAEALNQNDSLFFATLGLVAWLVGGFVFLCGTQALRKGLFALLFLLFMVPVPSVVMGSIVTFLQTGSAYAARAVLSLLGVPVYFEGMLISLPGVTVEVAEECSGVRSAMVLTMLSTFAAYLFLYSNWRRSILVLAVVPVTIFKNGLRVVTLALLGAYVDISYLTDSFIHSRGGQPFMLIAIAMMLPILWGLRRSERKARRMGAAAGESERLQGRVESAVQG